LEKRQIYRFGPYGLDAVAKVLLKDGQPVHLTRKAAETLFILVDRSPEVVTKEELMAEVWPDRVVDEANLAQNIAMVRKALEAQKGDPAWIETFPGRGYRLHGPVTLDQPDGHAAKPPPAADAAVPPKRIPRWPIAAAAVIVVMGAGLAYLWRRESQPPALHVTPVTRLAGKEFQPALSPDGAAVAFVWQQEDTRPAGIWLQTAGVSSPRRLTPEGPAWSSPAWSPDGRSIACLRFGGSSAEIVIFPAAGGPERVLASILPTRFGLAHHHLDWSPNGKTLAVDDSISLSQPLSIFLVDVATGQKTRLTQPEEFTIGDIDPRFSPDGRTLSFIRASHRARQDLFTIPVAGGPPVQLTFDARQISSQDWTPSSNLIFASSRGGEFRLWRAVPGKSPTPTSVYAEFPIQFSLARKSETLIYSVVQNDPNIWRLDFAGPRWQRVIASSAQDASPQYSPDGSRIAFRSDRSGEEEIWVSDAAGANPVQVTHGPQRPSVARWAPDGRQLVFNDAGTTDLFIADDRQGSWNVRPFGARGVHPVFSPDGRFVYAAGSGAILRFPASGGPAETVVPIRGLSLGVSPDGRYIYFVREPADTTLSRLEIQTGQMERVLDTLVPYCTSCWALSNEGIYYLGVRLKSPSQQSIYYLDLKTRASRLIADYPEPILPIGIGPFSLSPDMKSLLTVRLDPSNADLLRVDGFR